MTAILFISFYCSWEKGNPNPWHELKGLSLHLSHISSCIPFSNAKITPDDLGSLLPKSYFLWKIQAAFFLVAIYLFRSDLLK